MNSDSTKSTIEHVAPDLHVRRNEQMRDVHLDRAKLKPNVQTVDLEDGGRFDSDFAG